MTFYVLVCVRVRSDFVARVVSSRSKATLILGFGIHLFVRLRARKQSLLTHARSDNKKIRFFGNLLLNLNQNLISKEDIKAVVR